MLFCCDKSLARCEGVVTLSQCHNVTGGGGSVISVTKCDKAGGRSAVTPDKDKARGGLLSHSIPI